MSRGDAARALRPLRSGGGDPVRPSPRGPDDELEEVVARLLTLLGEDVRRPGLVETPARVARSLRRLTDGYARSATAAVGDAIFEEPHDGMVLVRGIGFHSLCEHHLLPFHGKVHVAYVPDGRVVGLSKVARLVEVFARRLQIQERFTRQVADALQDVLRPRGAAVAVEAEHLCMSMRGVERPGSTTLTRSWRGVFVEDTGLREEFLRLAARR